MPLIANEGEDKPRQMVPAGTHVARCYSIIDLGTHENPFGSSTRRVRFTWETPEEKAVFKEDKGEQPFVLSREYTLSLFEKANLRKDLESWRGKAFSKDELKGFDIFSMIGQPCLLSVIHKTSEKNGKEYAAISGISTLAKGMKAPKQINPSLEYSVDEGTNTVFLSLPGWLKEKIQGCSEWQDAETSDALETPPKEGDPDW